jgi:hypothetical protein
MDSRKEETLEEFIERLKKLIGERKDVSRTTMAEHGMLERTIAQAINGKDIDLCVSCGSPNMYQASPAGTSKYAVYRCEKCKVVVYRKEEEDAPEKVSTSGGQGFAHHLHTPRGDYFW